MDTGGGERKKGKEEQGNGTGADRERRREGERDERVGCPTTQRMDGWM